MSLVGRIVKSVGNAAVDIGKSALVIPNQSYKSITGKDAVKGLTDTKTGIGKLTVGLNKVGIDSGHEALRSFANTVTGGYASALHEKAVPGIVEKQKEEISKKTFSSGILSKFENTSEKFAPTVGQLGASLLNKKKESQSTPAQPAAPAGGMVSELIKSDTQPVSLLSKVTTGFTEFTKTPLGQVGIGVLGNYVQNLAMPKQQTQSALPQQLALQQGNVPVIPSTQTAAQKAVLEGYGIQISKSGASVTADTWWSRNQSWVLPVALAIPGLIIMLVMVFKRRR